MKTDTKIWERWVERAWALDGWTDKFALPMHVVVAEAVDVARFAQRNWEPTLGPNGEVRRPGLAAAAGKGAFSVETVTELLELVDVVQKAQVDYRLLATGTRAAPLERAQFVLGELRATLDWCFEDGQITEEDGRLEVLAQAHEGALSQDAVASALYDYAELAARHVAGLVGMGGFEARLIDEGRALSRALLEQSAGSGVLEPRPIEREALELRNRVTTMLIERVARVRSAARFVFRRHPELVREVSSAYVRRRRAEQRRKATEDAARVEADPAA